MTDALVPILCDDGQVIHFESNNKDTLPIVLQRMLGLVEGEFASPKRDKQKYLCKEDFNIYSKNLLRLFLFFRLVYYQIIQPK